VTQPDRLVRSPIFVLSSIRSGSTLLRCLFNSHSSLHAPHELHLVDLSVHADSRFAQLALNASGLDEQELEHLLWDRLLHRELSRCGKSQIVDKTPTNVLRWRRIRQCWPEARYVFLLRHPADIAASAIAARPHEAPERSVDLVRYFLERLDEARHELAGITLRYEDLANHPEATLHEVCVALDVPWEPAMLDYGANDHGPFISGVGDFGEKIHSGRVLPPRIRSEPVRTPPELEDACLRLGYR
jgi:hypothetical protein